MNTTELVEFILSRVVSKRSHSYSTLKKEYPEVADLIIKHTSFLDKPPLLARYYCIVNNITNLPACRTCKCPTKWTRLWKTGFQQYCSVRCKNLDPGQQKKAKQGIMDKYGVINISQLPLVIAKKKTNSMEKYGVEHPMQFNANKLKAIVTNKKRYGVEHPMQLEVFKDKAKNTNKKRYGVEYPMQLNMNKLKAIATNKKRYGTKHSKQQHISNSSMQKLTNKDWLYTQHIVKQLPLMEIAKSLGVWDTTVKKYMDLSGIQVKRYSSSVGEQQLFEFINTLGVSVVSNTRSIIPPKELDIYIPESKLAIEYNGLFWHSEQMGKDKRYHSDKTEECKKKGIQLIHVFEDDWELRPQIVKNTLKNKLHVSNGKSCYPRLTTVVSVGSAEKKQFLNKYHIQGNGRSSISYGLQDNQGELVAVMTFIQRTSGVFELSRFCTSCNVPGGFSKLLSYFKTHINWNTIITFADMGWSLGNLYTQNGFTIDQYIKPDYKYVISGSRVHKFNFRHKYLSKRLQNYNSKLSETQNCDNNGILRIWDCGKIRFILQR